MKDSVDIWFSVVILIWAINSLVDIVNFSVEIGDKNQVIVEKVKKEEPKKDEPKSNDIKADW